jgi:hypothetical protein
MRLVASDGTSVLCERWSDQPGLPELVRAPGEHLVRLRVPALLRAGEYVLGMWLGDAHSVYFDQQALRFSVLPQTGDRQEWLTRPRAVQPQVAWSCERVTP